MGLDQAVLPAVRSGKINAICMAQDKVATEAPRTLSIGLEARCLCRSSIDAKPANDFTVPITV